MPPGHHVKPPISFLPQGQACSQLGLRQHLESVDDGISQVASFLGTQACRRGWAKSVKVWGWQGEPGSQAWRMEGSGSEERVGLGEHGAQTCCTCKSLPGQEIHLRVKQGCDAS